MRHVGRAGHAVRQRGHVGATADGVQVPARREPVPDRDEVYRQLVGLDRADRAPYPGVRVATEVAGVQHLAGDGDAVGRDEAGSQHRAFRFEVVRGECSQAWFRARPARRGPSVTGDSTPLRTRDIVRVAALAGKALFCPAGRAGWPSALLLNPPASRRDRVRRSGRHAFRCGPERLCFNLRPPRVTGFDGRWGSAPALVRLCGRCRP